jgi:TRAP-type C4-dicarboxylate transport system substrate-binding protein
LKAKGMEVYEVPENELQAWRDATKPVWDLFIKENGKFGQELIDICVK